MTAALGLGIIALALAALYFAGEAKDAKVKMAQLTSDLEASRGIRVSSDSAREDEVARLKAELEVYKKSLAEKADIIAKCEDPAARREHLNDLGKVIKLV